MSLMAAVCGPLPAPDAVLPERLFPAGACTAAGDLETLKGPGFLGFIQPARYRHGAAPLTAVRDTARGVSVLFHGRLFNAAELAGSLGLDAAAPAATLLAEAYRNWGDGSVARLRGQFALILWDERGGRLLAARDPFGTVPLYYTRTPEGLALGVAAKQLYRLDGNGAGPDTGMIAEYLASDIYRNELFSTPRTLFKGVVRVLPGHYLTWDGGEPRQSIYWDPCDAMVRPKWRNPDPAEYRDLMQTVLADHSGDFAGVAAALSGGLDSTAILVLLDRANGGRTMPTASMSIGRRDGVSEQDNIRAVLAGVRADPHWVDPDDHDMFDAFGASAWQQECPAYSPSPAIFHVFKQQCRRFGMDILFSGVGADEVLGGFNLGYLADLFRHGRWLRMTRELRDYVRHDSLSFGRSPARLFREHVFDPFAAWRRADTLWPWINADFARAEGLPRPPYRHVRLPGCSAFDSATHAMLRGSYTPAFLQYETHNALAAGLEHRFPYLDQRIVDYALRLPWEERMSRGVYKVFHRRAFADLLPPQVVSQEVKTLVPKVHNRWLRETYREQVSDVLQDPAARCWAYFDREVVQDHHRRFLASGDLREQVQLRRGPWRALSLELWLRAFWP